MSIRSRSSRIPARIWSEGDGDLEGNRSGLRRGFVVSGKEMDFEVEKDFEFVGDGKSHEVEIEPVIFRLGKTRDLRFDPL